MAKILHVDLLSVPDVIHAGDNINDITVITKINFHPLDIKLEMEYCLHVFVFDIHGDVDPPLVLPNWDESKILSITLSRRDDYLGVSSKIIKATSVETEIEIPIAIKLGKLKKGTTYFSRKLEVFATIAPAVGRASKWSGPFEAEIVF